ncbi:MAG: alanine:cation symporter family protein, partial [Bradymonadaceae bacterium]
PGDVSHFQALSSALSATVGLGNIAGVAIAVSVGGPGAVFWMMVVALFGMSSKFAEATLGQMYREVDTVGDMRGGPMVYLKEGLANYGKTGEVLGWVLSLLFAVLCIGTSIGAGNMFQANQSFSALSEQVPWLAGGRATGSVRLKADEPRTVDKPDHMVEFVAPPRALDDSAASLSYRPADDRLKLSRDDWKQTDDGYRTTVPVESVQPGVQYNIRAGTVTSMKFAQLGEHGRSIDGWSTVRAVSVSNPDSIRGGTPPKGWIFGLILAFLVGMVIIGGIESIAKVAEKIVPFMCAFYILGGLAVIAMNVDKLGWAVGVIVSEAFNPKSAAVGSFMVVFVNGVKRAAFSSEAGIGSAPIAHSAAKTDEPVREGFVAMLGPFIDTIVVCFITGMVIVISGVWSNPETAGLAGVTLTSAAFGTELAWFPWVLTIAVVLFAFSTMISWSYYGERCWTYLFGDEQAMAFRFIFVFFVLVGSVSSLDNVLGFGDYFLLAMSFPNIVGVVLLSNEIDAELRDYWERYKAGEFD